MTVLHRWRKPIFTIVSLLAIAALFLWIDRAALERQAAIPAKKPAAAASASQPAPGASKFPKELPEIGTFRTVAENSLLILKTDSNTGHFVVQHRGNGTVWHSFPDPDHWPNEKVQGTWRNNLKSPVMYETVDLKRRGDKLRAGNIIEDGGEIAAFSSIPNGFQYTLSIPSRELEIPVQVVLTDDGVETRILSDGIKEGKLALVKLRLYPFMGAAHSVGQDGYMLIPDGTGGLIRFKQNREQSNYSYAERTYGLDWPFAHNTMRGPGRMTVNHPIIGIKSGDRSVLAIAHGGAEYTEMIASPSETFSKYNFISVQQMYRAPFFQPTSGTRRTADGKPQGYTAYNKDRFGETRTTSYKLLAGSKSDYVGMAEKYREHLIKVYGLQKLKPSKKDIPFFVEIMGGDREKGFLSDRYVPATSMTQAKSMVERLKQLGVSNMFITIRGWQSGGFSTLGGLFPVEKQLGGNEGMKAFAEYARAQGFPVFLHAYYGWRNVSGDGFNARNHAMVDLGGQALTYESRSTGGKETQISPRWMAEVIENDLPKYKELGVSGISFDSLGKYLNSDFNKKYTLNRTEALSLHQDLLRKTRETLGAVQADDIQAYALPHTDNIVDMAMDFSYDLFTDEIVPFAPIALHGLVSYTGRPVNDTFQYKEELLRLVEFGGNPTFIFSHADAKTMSKTYWANYYFNMTFEDWAETAAAEYARINKALHNVQDVFISGHRTIAPKVKETTYANGKRVIVNYNTERYSDGRITVPGLDFIVVEGGAN